MPKKLIKAIVGCFLDIALRENQAQIAQQLDEHTPPRRRFDADVSVDQTLKLPEDCKSTQMKERMILSANKKQWIHVPSAAVEPER